MKIKTQLLISMCLQHSQGDKTLKSKKMSGCILVCWLVFVIFQGHCISLSIWLKGFQNRDRLHPSVVPIGA